MKLRFTTTNIRIETDVLKEIKLRAVEKGKRMAELIRSAITQYLGKNEEKISVKKKRKDPFLSVIGMCKTGIKNDSEQLDEFLYGKKK